MKSTRPIPYDKSLDSTIPLLLEGYEFIQNRCNRYQSDIFRTQLLGKSVVCISGEDAAKLFYDDIRFKRKGVAPKRIQKTLFGKNGVQALDGVSHRNRKQMFMSIMTPDKLSVLHQLTQEQWKINSAKWKRRDSIVLFDETQKIMCQIACKWAGVPLKKSEVKQRANDLGKLVDGFGGIGLRYWQGKCARQKTESWIAAIVDQIRNHTLYPPKGSAADVIVWNRDENGKLLSKQVAAVELINILRPIVAIATYITFGALALHEYPKYQKKLQKGVEEDITYFVQEIRRFYPFAPFVGAEVRKNIRWKRYQLKKGTLVLLDLYGINHDSRLWENANEFWPERHVVQVDNKYKFVPHGGGDPMNGHRCAGEAVTIEIMKVSLDYLVNHLEYSVPKQDLGYSLTRIPTLPKSKFIMNWVR